MDPDVVFRPLRDHELPHGHAILCTAFQWLRHRHIKQWTASMPMSLYQAWQRHQWNYGLFVAGELAVVLSLVEGPLDEWRDGSDDAIVLWLHALATATHMKGRGFGRHAVRCAIDIAQARASVLYLLCAEGNGFLPAFYASLGFEEVKRASTYYVGLGVLGMVLMRRRG
jgi:ribosomal protein S18 acetylase RimI-like enzyme